MFYKESLEDELRERNSLIEALTEDLINMFDEAGFTQDVEVNGISFHTRQEGVYASFYVDTQLNYKGYITSNTSEKSNYSVSGNRSHVIDAANNFINLFFMELE